jgi:hypothetical protein
MVPPPPMAALHEYLFVDTAAANTAVSDLLPVTLIKSFGSPPRDASRIAVVYIQPDIKRNQAIAMTAAGRW